MKKSELRQLIREEILKEAQFSRKKVLDAFKKKFPEMSPYQYDTADGGQIRLLGKRAGAKEKSAPPVDKGIVEKVKQFAKTTDTLKGTSFNVMASRKQKKFEVVVNYHIGVRKTGQDWHNRVN